MSLKGTKRGAGVRGEEAGASKRRRTEQEDALWQLRTVSDLKMSSIYNRSASEAPAELFRKDLISAMKLPDSEPLTSSEYWVIIDAWKQEWERGVQVPVNPDSLPAPKVKVIDNPLPPDFQEFKLPRDKYIHLNRDSHYQAEKHLLSSTPARAEAACSYDLDAADTSWLRLLNAERARAGASPVTEDQLEKVIEELEVRTWDKIQAIIKSEEGLGIEYDENVICDVCRSPDSEDGNEMVFCDACNICVHQACYGITVIPDGQWLCRPCGDDVRPTCVLCPNLGGAMKCTPSGHKWAHVSCVLWIPEVSIGCAEKMEPITKISSIPTSRWSLVCVLCRERKGACIQCSVKTCKTAYHVTCAFKHGLEMRAIIEDESADDGVKLRSYCQKHSVNSKKEKCAGSGSEGEEEVKRKRRKDMTSEEKSQARAARLAEIEREFDRHVSVKDISTHLLDVDQDAINYIYNYWKLKRRAGHNRPLLPPKSDDNELLTHRQEQADLDKMRMFVQLRQDLERVRNLCYMVSRREKLSRSFFRMREQTFHKQVAVLAEEPDLEGPELAAILEANHGPSIYDRLYSHPNAPDHKNDFEELLARIAPLVEFCDEKNKDRNGLMKNSKASNPYKKQYVNGARRSGSMYSGLSSEESAAEMSRPSKFRGRAIGSSTDDDAEKSSTPKKKVSPKTKGKHDNKSPPKKTDKKKKKVPQSKAIIESSSEDDTITSRMKDRSRSKTLQQMEREMAATAGSGTDSDDIIPMKATRNSKFPIDIYSDSSEDVATKPETKADKSKTKSDKIKVEKSPHENDSQQSLPRTKAAMKEFVPTQPEKKAPVKEAPERPSPKKRGRKPSNKGKTTPGKSNESDNEAKNKENIKSKQKDNPTDMIVPQRQAAKKASENMRSTTIAKKEEPGSDKQMSGDDTKATGKPKVKSKGKEGKEAIPAKVGRKKSSKDTDKETIAYVPQRQAAKKAAAHIKSGLGTKVPMTEADADKKKDEKPDITKTVSPKKEDTKSKAPNESSSCSSNSCSSSYSSSSSSEEDTEKHIEMKPTVKAREIKPLPRPASLFSPPGSRPTVDLPFLDKVSRPLSSTSGASSDSDSSKRSQISSSSSPHPKRPRRRRKGKSLSTEAPLKATDKKLKTSEQRSECEPPSLAEGAEPRRAGDARAATRARTRSTASIGNMPHKSDARQRKPSKDEGPTAGPNKTPKESGQPSQLPTPERKVHKEVKEIMTSPKVETKIESKAKTPKNKRRSESTDDKEKIIKPPEKESSHQKSSPRGPRKSAELKHKPVSGRRASVKDPSPKDIKSPQPEPRETIKARRQSRHDKTPKSEHLSPVKIISPNEKAVDLARKKSPANKKDEFAESDKEWMPKAPSPSICLPPIEKPGGHEKYMTEDKTLDADFPEKSSINMIAKIQATLNENTMIRSPKTPMDARTMDVIDIENPAVKTVKCNKRSTVDTDKKFITQDASHVQGVEISKSAKIPSAINPYPQRSIFSPHKENFEYDMLGEDGFNHEDAMKPFITYPEIFLKEDSKEQGVQETLNLVDRLRMQYGNKKPAENSDENAAEDEKYSTDENNIATNSIRTETPPPNKNALELQDKKVTPKEDLNHLPLDGSAHSMARDVSMESKEERPHAARWPGLPVTQNETNPEAHNERSYEHTHPYNEEIKEPITVQSDAQSLSEVGDSVSLSKQSDDSQSLSVVDHSVHSNDQELTQDNQNYDNNNSMIHSDCATISSPYGTRHDSKWRESKIATRRSSASSTNSDASACSKTDMKSQNLAIDCHRHRPMMPEMEPYPPMPAYSCPVEQAMPLNQYTGYAPDSPFLTSMSLFGAGGCGSVMPSPGAALFPPGLSFPPPPLLQPLSKPNFPLCAAFTSSSQNIALTTAMIAPPTPKPQDSPRDDLDVTGSDKFSIHVASSPSVSVDSFNDSRAPTKMSSDSNETITHSQDSKSSPKPAKILPKFPGKSPGKSPAGISPKQTEGKTKRTSNRSNRSQRGRGRSKSRAAAHGFPSVDYMGNSIQSKLVGTVYDFDEEIANDGVGLKALRDRRKSVDVRDERKSEHSYKDASPSPRLANSPQNKKLPPIESKETKIASPEFKKDTDDTIKSGFSQVQPVLPGPVDMRRYHPPESSASAPEPAPVYDTSYKANTHVEYPSVMADQPTSYDALDVRKRTPSKETNAFDSTLAAPQQPESIEQEIIPPILPKVSLSDSRNQLKVKIKGPFLDANYSASCQPTPAPPPPVHALEPPVAPAIGGSGNLRRMRKKELLRQYWTQDMNMDDPANLTGLGIAPPPVQPQPLARAVITIPKAVASMTSIPTREDYRISESPIEKKKRKTTSGLSRELRHLEVSMNDDVDPTDETKSCSSQAHKRRGRVSTKPSKATSPVAPKLKIKIGSNVVQQVKDESFQFRPPKKRIMQPAPPPSLEDLRRESMKYRRKVMADFEEHDKPKKIKLNKSEKRKKKKDKKAEKLQVVNAKSESATKLIIKIKRPKEEEASEARKRVEVRGTSGSAAAEPVVPVDPFEYDPSAPDPLAIDPPSYSGASSAMRKIRTAKVTPIRLKLARSSQGSGYVMQQPGKEAGDAATPLDAADVVAHEPHPVVADQKHCEVR